MTQDIELTQPVKEPLPEVSRNGVRIGPKYEAFQILRENGLNAGRAAQALGMSKTNGYLIEQRLNKKYDVKGEKYIKPASKVILNVLKNVPKEEKQTIKSEDGQDIEITKKVYPTFSNQIDVAKDLYARYQPIIQRSINLNASIDIHPVNLEEFL